MDRTNNILVVDDQLGVRALLSMALKAKGFLVETATNGQEGIDKIKEKKTDLVIMDVKMPVKDGVEALYEMKELDPNTHIIMMTAFGETHTVEKIKKGGANKLVAKPFDIEELINYVCDFFMYK